MALMAFTSFSLLVAGGVAVSNGSEVAPWQPAMAQDPQGPQRPASAASTGSDDAARPGEASLFAAVADPEAIATAKDTSLVSLSRVSSPTNGAAGAGNGSGSGGRAAVPPMTSAEHAPPIFEGELPVNTLIAPAQPVIVLKGGEFGWRVAPDDGRRELHNGTDISAPEGAPVVSALDGTVTAVFWDVWGGNRVEVSHANGMKTTYNHMSKVMVRVGDHLKASEQLGAVGHTGMRVTGPHLHFETWVTGKVVDPQSFDWKSGKGIIPASRPAYSNADQAGVAQPPAVARPGTDGGHAPKKAPAKSEDEIRALGQKTAPTKAPAQEQKKVPTKKPAPKPSQGLGDGQILAGGSSQQPPNTGAPNIGRAPVTGGTGGRTGKPQPPVVHPPKDPTVPRPSAERPGDHTKPDPGTKPKPPVVENPPVKEKPPVKDKPPVIPGEPKPVNPLMDPITNLATEVQLQQRTKATVGAHLLLSEEAQKTAYSTGSPLDTELKALVARGNALKLSPADPYMEKLVAASNAVTGASPPPGSMKAVDPEQTKAATAALQALQTQLAAVPAYIPPVDGGK